ncbi:MAG: hypothetical protein E6G94_09565, partial [Alphaproteobacteria bacterium]
MVLPAPPGLSLSAPGLSYALGGLTVTGSAYLKALKALFNQLAVQVEQEQKGGEAEAMLAAADPQDSIAGFVYGAWFAMLARQIAQAMLQGLRSYHYQPATPGETVSASLAALATQLGSGIDAATLFEANPRHPLAPGATLQVGGASLTSGTAETFAAVAGRAFAPGSTYFTGTALALANPDAFLVGGKPFTYNGAAQASAPGDTLASVAKRLATDVPGLVHGSDIASTVPLIAASPLTAPVFAYPAAAGDTLETLAARFSVTVSNFAAATDLGQSLFLFDANDGFLVLPHLTTAKAGALIGEAARAGAFRHASGMVSRFMLHGLRLPTAGVTPTAAALFTQPSGSGYAYTVPEAGLFALTGQQIGLPNPLPGDYAIGLASATPWLTLGGGAQMAFKVADYAHEADRIATLQQWLGGNILQVQLDSLAPKPAVSFSAASYSVKSGISWTNLGKVTLPVGGTVAAAAGLTLLQLPSEVGDLGAQTLTVGTGANARIVTPDAPPAFSLDIVRYDEPTGESFSEPASAYGWGTMIALKLRRAQGTNAAADTYELVGADQAGIILLERLLEANGDSDAAFAGMAVLYGSDVRSSTGLISDDMATAQAGLIQANLTTVTLPPASLAAMAQAGDGGPAWTTVYNPKLIELLRFVWEASITRSGGFYLYYFDEGRQQGLPDRLFNDHGEATVQLLVAHNDPASVPSYANVALLGQGIAGGSLAVTATASRPAVTVSLADTLAAIALRAYLSPSAAAEQLAAQPLADGSVLSVAGGVYQVQSVAPASGSPGADPAAVAAWFGTSVSALQAVNPNVPASWWSGLPLLSAIRLPTVQAAASAARGLGTLASIAAYYGTTVEQLGADNKDATGLFAAGTSPPLAAGPVTANANQPPGVVGYLAERPPAPTPSTDPTQFDANVLLQSLFTMLGYSVFGNQDFVTVQALPAGPQNATSTGKGKIRAAVATGDDWRYLLNIPTYRCLAGWTPDQPDNPYAALARLLQVDLHWQDVFGNRLLQPAPDQPIGAGCYNRPPVLTGYTDRLIGAGGWPSVGASWQVTKPGQLTVRLTFNLERYQAGSNPPDPLPDYVKIAARDLSVYTDVLRQLGDPAGVAFSVQTSLAAAGTIPLSDGGQAIRNWLAAIVQYLGAIADGTAPTAPTNLLSFDVPLGDLAANDVSAVGVALVIARNPSLVLGAADDVPGVATASTILAPAINSRPNAPPDPLEPPPPPANSLAEFASAFETALSTASTTVKLAAGPDRYSGKGPQQLWTVRVAASGEGIGYQFANWPGSSGGSAGRPIVYARRPISRTLESRPAVPIWPFDPTKLLQPGTAGYQSRAFSQIDIETWALTYCDAFDRILTPSYAAPALILDHLQGTASMKRLRDAKDLAAGALSRLMLPVFNDDPVLALPEGPSSPLSQAREAYRQTLLGKLANGFVSDVVVQCPAIVAA